MQQNKHIVQVLRVNRIVLGPLSLNDICFEIGTEKCCFAEIFAKKRALWCKMTYTYCLPCSAFSSAILLELIGFFFSRVRLLEQVCIFSNGSTKSATGIAVFVHVFVSLDNCTVEPSDKVHTKSSSPRCLRSLEGADDCVLYWSQFLVCQVLPQSGRFLWVMLGLLHYLNSVCVTTLVVSIDSLRSAQRIHWNSQCEMWHASVDLQHGLYYARVDFYVLCCFSQVFDAFHTEGDISCVTVVRSRQPQWMAYFSHHSVDYLCVFPWILFVFKFASIDKNFWAGNWIVSSGKGCYLCCGRLCLTCLASNLYVTWFCRFSFYFAAKRWMQRTELNNEH